MSTWRAACVAACLFPLAAAAETVRVATFNTELERDGPGLMLRDLLAGDPQAAAVAEVIVRVAPDILAVQGIDWDHDSAALAAFADVLAAAGVDYPHRFALQPNAGLATTLDLDGDGRTGGPGDAQGFGAFTGQGGIALLSHFPIDKDGVQDFSDLLWRDLPGALLPEREDGGPYPSDDALAVQRLSSNAHWAVPVLMPDGERLTVLTFQAGPPVFDGPEDRNGRRNHDEILFWLAYLDGTFGPPPDRRFVIMGGANLDPFDSDGRSEAIRAVLADPRLHDPQPQSPGGATAGAQGHKGEDALDTVDWPEVGRLRVDYVLPSADLSVTGAGVYWPAPDQDGTSAALAASRHRLVWVDLTFD